MYLFQKARVWWAIGDAVFFLSTFFMLAFAGRRGPQPAMFIAFALVVASGILQWSIWRRVRRLLKETGPEFCPRCGYWRRMLPEDQLCPECGHTCDRDEVRRLLNSYGFPQPPDDSQVKVTREH